MSLQNEYRPAAPAARRAQLNLDFGNFGNLLAVGLIGLGLLAIGLGWNGAAGVTTTVQQMPYILSGGLLGLALVLIGVMVVMIQHMRTERAALEVKLDRIAELLGGAPAAAPAPFGVPTYAPQAYAGQQFATPVAFPAAAPAAPMPQDLSGLVAAGQASFHTPGCRLVDGRETVDYLTPEEASSRGLKACRVCQPSNVAVR